MAKAKSPEVVMNRRKEAKPVADRRTKTERRQGSTSPVSSSPESKVPAVAKEQRVAERRTKQPRRRQIDPTTCERDYNLEEIEFMQALDAYKRANGRMFPTCSEILEVIRGLGYVRLLAAAQPLEVAAQVDSLA
jgi:hypothetical protein